jgi:hypothetical protein
MKALLQNPIGIDDLSQLVLSYARENHGQMPRYLLVHPKTDHNIILSIPNDHHLTIQVTAMENTSDGIVRGRQKFMDVYIIRTYDVEEGFIILCR